MLKIRILTLLVVGLLSFLPDRLAASRIGIIVAIGDYERAGNGYTNLSSARDAVLIDSVLLQNSFDRIITLKDEHASKKSIVEAIESVINSVNSGDVVLIHFSCHGILISDEEGRYAEECLVAWDSPFHLQAGKSYHGEKHLTYSELNLLRNRLRLKAGKSGDVIMLFDACHSGGLTRGRDKTRGIATPMKIKGWRSGNSTVKEPDNSNTSSNATFDEMSPYVAIAACKTEQSNRETNDGHHACGSLSFVFVKALLSSTNTNENYDHLYDVICEEMFRIHPGQHPVMTGVLTNRKLFGGQFIPQDEHYRIISFSKKTGQFTIDAGKLKGITSGSEFEAVPVNSSDGEMPVLHFVLNNEPGILSSRVTLQSEVPADFNYKAYYLQLTKLGVDSKKITVNIDSLQFIKPDYANKLIRYFAEDSEIDINNSASELFLIPHPSSTRVEIRFVSDGSLLRLIDETPDSLKQYLIGYYQYNALRRLSLRNEEYKVSCSLLTDKDSDAGNTIYEGSTVKLCIDNLTGSRKSVFVNVFDFMPDGQYRLILEDVQIACAASKCINSHVSAPYGRESIMVVSTPRALKLSMLSGMARDKMFNSRGSNLGLIQQIFGNPVNGKVRGVDPYDEEGFSTIINFTIAPETNY